MEIANVFFAHLKINPSNFLKENPGLAKEAFLKCLVHNDFQSIKFFGEYLDVNFGNECHDPINPLIYACHNGYFEIVEYLIEIKNANIDYLSAGGTLPIMYAGQGHHFDIVWYLYQKGSSLSTDDKGRKYNLYSFMLRSDAMVLRINRDLAEKNKRVTTLIEEIALLKEKLILFSASIDCSKKCKVQKTNESTDCWKRCVTTVQQPEESPEIKPMEKCVTEVQKIEELPALKPTDDWNVTFNEICDQVEKKFENSPNKENLMKLLEILQLKKN